MVAISFLSPLYVLGQLCPDNLLALMWHLLPCCLLPVCFLYQQHVRTGYSGCSPPFCYLRAWVGETSVLGYMQSLLKYVGSPPFPEILMNILYQHLLYCPPSLPLAPGVLGHFSLEELDILFAFQFHLFLPSPLVKREKR